MSGLRYGRDLPGLHIDMRARPPTADYRCRCGWTTVATGDQVRHIQQRIDAHKTTCTAPEGREAP